MNKIFSILLIAMLLVMPMLTSCGEHEHKFEEVVVGPTCDSDGYREYICSDPDCGYSYREVTSPAAHQYGAWTVVTPAGCHDDGLERRECSCGSFEERTIEAENEILVVVTEPTCKDGGYTTESCVCGYLNVHSETGAVDHNNEPATCTEASVCTLCNVEFERALGHSEVTDIAVDPTCTETGLTEGKHCERCGEVFVAQETVDATGHTYGEEKIPSGCLTKGYTLHMCHCGDFYKTHYIKANGHSYVANAVAPKCEEQGYTEYVCHCGDSYRDDYVDAAGHKYEVFDVVAPACTENGYTVYKCAECGDSYNDDYTDPQHTYAAEVTPPTYTEYGYTTYTCHCGDTYVGDHTDLDFTKGLEYGLLFDKTYAVVGLGDFEGTVLAIPSTYREDKSYKGWIVTQIGYYALQNGRDIETVILPGTVTYFDMFSFCGLSDLTSIIYNGTVEQWNEIEKHSTWDSGTGEYTVYCTDGEITK